MDLISEDKLKHLAGSHGLNVFYLEKDYFLTLFLFLIKDIRRLFFKGGTALNKIFLNHKRLSEDLDFTAGAPIAEIRREIEKVLGENKNIFTKIETDKTTTDFVRYKVFYKSYFHKEAYIIVDINKKASIVLKPEGHEVPNFYGLKFQIQTLALNEIIAEKFRAAITRNKPRDYFDLYFILQKRKIDIALAKRKLKEAGEKFDTERIFKNANKIYSNWDEDIGKLTNEKLDFVSCIKFLRSKIK